MSLLQSGDPAPNFSLTDADGSTFTLSADSGKPMVVFFYPKADTPGCTIEGQDFTRLNPEFKKLGITVIGISADSVDAQCKFRDKYDLGVPLLSDPDHVALNAFGAWGEKQNYGKTYMGIIRSTFLIGTDGKIAQSWKVARVKDHAQKVLEHAQQLLG